MTESSGHDPDPYFGELVDARDEFVGAVLEETPLLVGCVGLVLFNVLTLAALVAAGRWAIAAVTGALPW